MQQRQQAGSQFSLTQRPAQSSFQTERERALAAPGGNNRARMSNLPASYTIAPRSTFDGTRGTDHRPVGSGGAEAFRKMTQKNKKRS